MDIRLLSLLKKGKEVENFKITDITKGEVPDGLSPEILQALWQICLCFGEQHDSIFCFKWEAEGNNFLIEIIFMDGVENHHAFAVRRPETLPRPMDGFNWLGLNTSAFLLWDEKIDPEDIAKSIREIDCIALKNGQIVKNERTKSGISCIEAEGLCNIYN